MRDKTGINLPDARMIELMEYAVKNDIARNEGEYWKLIKFQRTGISAIRDGIQSFRVHHITNACLLTGASADWVHGIENAMFRHSEVKSTSQTLKEIAAEMEGKRPKVRRWQEMSLFGKDNLHA